jgi:hypothetical protein
LNEGGIGQRGAVRRAKTGIGNITILAVLIVGRVGTAKTGRTNTPQPMTAKVNEPNE